MSPNFDMTVSFLELYQAVIYDQLANKPKDQSVLGIREDSQKGVYIPGSMALPA